MTKADKAAFADFRGKLQAHEEGHMIIAEDYAKEISGTIKKASESTRKKAKKELQNELNKHRQEAQNTLDERRIAYDEKTDHGRKQSEVGGEDVRLDCPTGYKFSDLSTTVKFIDPDDGELLSTTTVTYSGHVCGDPFETKWNVKQTLSNTQAGTHVQNIEAIFLHDGEPPDPVWGAFYFLPGEDPQVKLLDLVNHHVGLPKHPRIAIVPAEENTNCP